MEFLKNKKVLILLLILFSLSYNIIYSGYAETNGNFGSSDSPGEPCNDPFADPSEREHAGCGGECSGGNGGDGGDGGDAPSCVPCVLSCISEPNSCGQYAIGTKDPCCGSGQCSAQTPNDPSFTKEDGSSVKYGDTCSIGDKTPLPNECRGSIGCSGRCEPQCFGEECSICFRTGDPPPPPPPPPTPCIMSTSDDYKIINRTNSNNYIQINTGTTTDIYTISTSEVQTSINTSLVSTTTYKWGEPGKFKVRLIAVPKLIKKGEETTLFLFMKNVESCDIASSDGLFWKNVGKDTIKTGSFNFATINTKVFGETKFRIIKCYVNNSLIKNEVSSQVQTISTTTNNTIEYIPTNFGWSCVEKFENMENVTERCVISDNVCVHDNGNTDIISTYNICMKDRETYEYHQDCDVPYNNEQAESNGPYMVGWSESYNGEYGEQEGFLGSFVIVVTQSKLTVPVLPPASNKIEETVYLVSSWKER